MTATTPPLPALPQTSDLLCFGIYATAHAFNRVYKPLLDPLGLTYPQFLVMVSLWARDDQTVGDLGETLFLESSTLTPLIKRLEANGLVTRARDRSDERQVRVRLTPAGAELQAATRDLPACVIAATGMSHEQLMRLHRDITALHKNLRGAPRA